MVTSNMKIGAGLTAIIYIIIQSYQAWVFDKIPETGNFLDDFLAGANTLHIIRSWLMLIAMFGLFYLFFTLCFDNYANNKAWSIIAFSAFFVFFFLEIIMRSVELLYIQTYLPKAYTSANSSTRQQIILIVTVIQRVQGALYFPLMAAQMLGSFLLFLTYKSLLSIVWLLKAAFLINALRLAVRMVTVYGNVENTLGTLLDTSLYLPLVYIIYGSMAVWLLVSAKKRAV
ncbi:hypothetical protein GS399_19115 [Pedobacter sp. HMF7647]|uniref:DUF4386 family protein n=1 Tax=Hufsiella arboris TaxID=2695275 RepID=A0A7K1YEQ3_9SPHI|nr:hypothetical protein [Hufsiella arboris]MXV53086.1 hypothetical protein [Hufsiella arboris]